MISKTGICFALIQPRADPSDLLHANARFTTSCRILAGSYSAVSKPMFVRKYSFCSITLCKCCTCWKRKYMKLLHLVAHVRTILTSEKQSQQIGKRKQQLQQLSFTIAYTGRQQAVARVRSPWRKLLLDPHLPNICVGGSEESIFNGELGTVLSRLYQSNRSRLKSIRLLWSINQCVVWYQS